MKHFVFTAGHFPENQEAIDNALKVVDILKWQWEMDATVTGIFDGSQITVNKNDGNNTSVCIEDDDLHRLITSCIAFTREMTKLKYKQ